METARETFHVRESSFAGTISKQNGENYGVGGVRAEPVLLVVTLSVMPPQSQGLQGDLSPPRLRTHWLLLILQGLFTTIVPPGQRLLKRHAARSIPVFLTRPLERAYHSHGRKRGSHGSHG